jgi:hypothetical protein
MTATKRPLQIIWSSLSHLSLSLSQILHVICVEVFCCVLGNWV